MNLLSVTERKWVLKKYNSEDASFIKDNFFLDEITSKLLAIKKIKRVGFVGDSPKEDWKSIKRPNLFHDI